MEATKMSLKLLIDKKSRKVIFAETGKEFVDFLLSLLSLPLGRIIMLLNTQKMVGSISNLYESFKNLSEAYVQPHVRKDSLLYPATTTIALPLPFGIEVSPVEKLYKCFNQSHTYLSEARGTTCPSCSPYHAYATMQEEVQVQYVKPAGAKRNTSSNGGGGYVKGLITYMVMDDLSVSPISVISGISVLNKCNITEFDRLEEQVVEFGLDEGLQLLKASLETKEVLTRVYLGNLCSMKDATGKSDGL